VLRADVLVEPTRAADTPYPIHFSEV